MLLNQLGEYKVILGSGSPRRKELLTQMGFSFEVVTHNVEENPPNYLQREEVALFLAAQKAAPFKNELLEDTLIITADTIVVLGNSILHKPQDPAQAEQMIRELSGKNHEVITGVCLMLNDEIVSFYESTSVFFKELTDDEIRYYVEKYSPVDKAGSYAIQEWIGKIGIEKIEGDYYNVVGLPTSKLYSEIKKLLAKVEA